MIDFDVGEPCNCYQCYDRWWYWPHISRYDSDHGQIKEFDKVEEIGV